MNPTTISFEIMLCRHLLQTALFVQQLLPRTNGSGSVMTNFLREIIDRTAVQISLLQEILERQKKNLELRVEHLEVIAREELQGIPEATETVIEVLKSLDPDRRMKAIAFINQLESEQLEQLNTQFQLKE